MRKLAYKIWAMLVTAFGNIKVFKFPMFVVYDPSFFKMDGKHILKAFQSLQPGDIVLRGFDSYLASYFIDDPYMYSHGAIYMGKGQIVHAIAQGVSKIDALDFMRCDRICILRPAKCVKKALSIAKKFLEDNVPYDFSFNESASAVYCFELCALCYPSLDIKTISFKKMFGLMRRNAYLADSFRKSKDFEIVFEYNPKFKIDR